jgi:hypothetical protein
MRKLKASSLTLPPILKELFGMSGCGTEEKIDWWGRWSAFWGKADPLPAARDSRPWHSGDEVVLLCCRG